MVNPSQFDPNTLALIASLGGGLAGKPGAQLTSSDVSRIFAPDLGALTGTYTGRTESEEDIFGRSAPYFSQIRNNPESDEIAFAITEDIAAGLPLIQTKKKLRELTNSLSKDERDDYMDLLNTLSKEYNNYNQESLKYKNRETFFSKAGLPEPDAPTMATVSPALTLRSTPCKTETLKPPSEKRLLKPRTSSTGCWVTSLITQSFRRVDLAGAPAWIERCHKGQDQ